MLYPEQQTTIFLNSCWMSILMVSLNVGEKSLFSMAATSQIGQGLILLYKLYLFIFSLHLADLQRFGSQEKDNSLRRVSCLPPVSYPREESQVPVSRSSSSLTRRWSSATVLDHKCMFSSCCKEYVRFSFFNLLATQWKSIALGLGSVGFIKWDVSLKTIVEFLCL